MNERVIWRDGDQALLSGKPEQSNAAVERGRAPVVVGLFQVIGCRFGGEEEPGEAVCFEDLRANQRVPN